MQLKLEYTLQRLIRKWGTQKITLKCHYCNSEYWIETELMLSSQLWHIDEINGDKKKVPIKCKSARLIAWFFPNTKLSDVKMNKKKLWLYHGIVIN